MIKRVRIVEMFVGYGSNPGTWDTVHVEIPIETPKGKIRKLAEEACQKLCQQGKLKDVAFFGIYNIPEDED